jgi:hypothetical protein
VVKCQRYSNGKLTVKYYQLSKKEELNVKGAVALDQLEGLTIKMYVVTVVTTYLEVIKTNLFIE